MPLWVRIFNSLVAILFCKGPQTCGNVYFTWTRKLNESINSENLSYVKFFSLSATSCYAS
ncbi:hypothetical protein GLYMA_05G196200v4 [Glycine max]|nr:hypothetical protein GLYMA_05G196200v4 [Glycine max]KAH1135307.1 hypothetical protein GYH30_013196 [Glycine max]